MRNYIFVGLLLCVISLAGCVQREPAKKTSKEQEVAMQTEAGREAYIAEELYEGAKIISEIKNEETGFIVSEFLAGDFHSFVFFRPTEKGYAYNGDADGTLDGMITEDYAPMGDGDYHVFLRHSEDIVSIDVTYFDADTNEMLQTGTVTFTDSNLALILRDEEINHWRARIVVYDKEGQEYILADGEPPSIDLEELEKEKERRLVRKVIKFAVIFGAACVGSTVGTMVGTKIRRKK